MTISTSFEWNGGSCCAVEKVQLAGSFTQWKPVDMEKNSAESTGEKWALKLDLSPGEYEFKFVVDGKWLHNELLPTKTNDEGIINNVITVEEKALSMSTSSSIEAINEEELNEADDEGWEVLQNPQIEIERKFIVPDNYHERLTAQGFQLQQEFDEVLVDKYYDTHEHDLIKEDHWLRQRNGDWELKYPVGLDGHKQGSTLYHETTCIEEIMTRLRPILKVEESCSLLQNLLEKTYLKPFAQLETKRKCYSREDKVNIVIDATDWGHSVGEIEIMVMDHDHITEATSKIETIGAELDFSHMDLKALCSKACN